MQVLSIDQDAASLFPTFEFNYDSVLFLQTVTCLKIIRFHLMTGQGQCSANAVFKNIIEAGTGFISRDSRRSCCALLTAFLSNWIILSFSKRLQFLLTVSSEERISYRLRKSSKRLVRSNSLEDISSTLISSSVNSSFERFSSWLLVRTIMIYEYR